MGGSGEAARVAAKAEERVDPGAWGGERGGPGVDGGDLAGKVGQVGMADPVVAKEAGGAGSVVTAAMVAASVDSVV